MSKSMIAYINASFRMMESEKENSLLDDPYAKKFTDKNKKLSLLRVAHEKLGLFSKSYTRYHNAHCIRHGSIDILIKKLIGEQDIEQVVILGAGFDTRSLRFQKLNPEVKWFEVDRREIQEEKKKIFKESGALYITADLLKDDLSLITNQLDPSKKTCFLAEGLIHYLDKETFYKIVESFESIKEDKHFIFSFIRPQMRAGAATSLKMIFAFLSEIPKTFFYFDELKSSFEERGWRETNIWDVQGQITDILLKNNNFELASTQDVALVTKRSQG